MLEPDFIEVSRSILRRYGVKPQQLEIELTESVLDGDFNRIATIISQLKQVGVSIAIDDFGKGASSLARIKKWKWMSSNWIKISWRTMPRTKKASWF